MRARIERERKKRMEIEARLAESEKIRGQEINNKEWRPLGGLGPNLGGDEWRKKKDMQIKMLVRIHLLRNLRRKSSRSIFTASVHGPTSVGLNWLPP